MYKYDDAKLKKAGYKKVGTVSQDIKKMESSGVNVHAALGYQGYKDAIVNFHGGTYAKKVKGGYKIAVNSAVMKVIIWGGTSAALAAISPALKAVGCPAAIIGDICACVYVTVKYATRKAHKSGGYVTVTRKRYAHHHKHHKTTYSYGHWHHKFGYQ